VRKDCLVTARHRFVLGGWLLLAGIVLATVGVLAWSHLDFNQRVVARQPTVCVAPPKEQGAQTLKVAPPPTRLPQHQVAPPEGGTVTLIIRSRQPGDICSGGGLLVLGVHTTPNHVPGVVLVALAGVAGVTGVVLLRRPPD
jgi:hypothetical protein